MVLSEALGKGKQSVYRGHPVYGEGQPERLEEVISSLKSKGKVLGACLSNPGIVSGQAAFMSSVSFDSDITRTQSWEDIPGGQTMPVETQQSERQTSNRVMYDEIR